VLMRDVWGRVGVGDGAVVGGWGGGRKLLEHRRPASSIVTVSNELYHELRFTVPRN